MQHRAIDHASFGEHHLSLVADRDQPAEQAARPLFESVARALRDGRLEPLQQKVFGPSWCRAEVLEARAQAFAEADLDPSAPCLYLSGRLDHAEPLSAQVWAVSPRGTEVRVTTTGGDDGPRGRLLEAPSLRLLWLSGIDGGDDDGDFGEQAGRMFKRAEQALRAEGLGYRDVARTWIYVQRLLDDYDELNEVRTAFHREHDILGGAGPGAFPASTGIQGSSAGERCLMELVAATGPDGLRRPLLDSSRQPAAFDYGSGFSRGMVLSHEGVRTVFVSGTASIGSDGRTRHVDDAEGQILQTLLSLAALLEPEGASLCDLAAGTLFAKDRAALDAYEQVTRLLGVPTLPLVPVLADVCRPELLVEIDALALLDGAAATEEGVP